MIPETRYARTPDGFHVAYQVAGVGPVDIVFVPGWFGNVDLIWEQPEIVPFLERVASFARLILFDRRGTGLSDHFTDPPDLDTMMDDIRAVMDAAGSKRAVLIGLTIGGAIASVFAAALPERTLGLVLIQVTAKVARAEDYPWGDSLEEFREETSVIETGWGTGGFERWFLEGIEHPRAHDPEYVARTARYLRHGMSPGGAVVQNRIWHELDFRGALPVVHVPTLVVERHRAISPHSEYLLDRIAGAELAHLPEEPIIPWLPGSERTAERIERFVTSIREEEGDLERVLATVLFTDVVDSTKRASEVGDERWRQILEEHDRIVRGQLARYRGQEIKTMGDGFLATFDGPARAVRCASAIVRGVRRIGLELRAGLHTGECQVVGDDVSGIAVAIGARVGALAGPGEVLVSSTVKDLVVGSGLSFEDGGEHELKGVPDRWRLYRVVVE